jgi:hypothetical protein
MFKVQSKIQSCSDLGSGADAGQFTSRDQSDPPTGVCPRPVDKVLPLIPSRHGICQVPFAGFRGFGLQPSAFSLLMRLT